MITVISVRFRSGSKTYYFDPGNVLVRTGDPVIVETSQGPEYATCSAGNHQVEDSQVVQPLRPLIRVATENDRRTAEYNQQRESEAFEICQKKIQQHKLEMKLVRVECSFDGNKILFFFTADGRVDFRELVKDLAGVFRSRIELRQIGVRDEAKMLGGLGICGRPFCCSQFLNEFQPVSIKMAKTQNLSLNPTKISGTCGRLMCCLKYEQDAYEDLVKHSPKADSFVETPDGAGTVTSVNLLRETVQVRLDNDPETARCYHNCELCVVRNGKGRRPEGYVEPPLEELAKLRKQPEEPIIPVLESSGNSLGAAIEAVFQRSENPGSVPNEKEDGENRRRRDRRRRPNKPEGMENRAQTTEKPEHVEKTEAPRPRNVREPKPQIQNHPVPAEGEGAPKQDNRRPFHRRRRRPGGGKPQGESK